MIPTFQRVRCGTLQMLCSHSRRSIHAISTSWSRGYSDDTIERTKGNTKFEISNLDPKILSPNDIVNFSFQREVYLNNTISPSSYPMVGPIYFRREVTSVTHFPEEAQGQLYLCKNSFLPVAASEIRLKSSVTGKDLMDPYRMKPWGIPLYRIGVHPGYEPIEDLLVKQHLVSSKTFKRIRQLYPPSWGERPPTYILHRLDEVIPISVAKKEYRLHVVGKHEIREVHFNTTFLGPGPYKMKCKYFKTMAHVRIQYDTDRDEFFTQIVQPPVPVNEESETKYPMPAKGTRRVFDAYEDPSDALSILLP